MAGKVYGWRETSVSPGTHCEVQCTRHPHKSRFLECIVSTRVLLTDALMPVYSVFLVKRKPRLFASFTKVASSVDKQSMLIRVEQKH